MRILPAMVLVLLIGLAAGPLMASDYRITVKLQEFSVPDGKAIDVKKVMSEPGGLAELTAGETRFLHQTKLPAQGATEAEVKIGKTEAKVGYKMGEEKDGKIFVSVSVELAETVAVKDGVPVKSMRSVKTAMDFPIGKEMPLGGQAFYDENKITIFTILVLK